MTDKIKDIINNFSDMKIIKALECCIIGDCDNCSFYETRELCPNLFLFVSDLIKRQEAVVEALINGQETLQKYIAEQKAEIERLKRKLVGYEPSIDSGLFSQMLLEQKEKAEAFEKKWKAEIKSEAYSEFAEKINAEAEKVEIDREGDFVEAENKIYYTVADWCNATSDNLLKELVGEDDESTN